MKKILILFMTIFGMNIANGQTSADTIYLIASPILNNDNEGKEGIFRDNSIKYQSDPLYKYPPIHIELISKKRNIWELFTHYNFNPTELSKTRPVEPMDEMVILIKPIEFLQTVRLTDLDIIFPSISASKKSTEDFARSMQGKTVFFIDRNEITQTTVKLIQVEYDTPDSY